MLTLPGLNRRFESFGLMTICHLTRPVDSILNFLKGVDAKGSISDRSVSSTVCQPFFEQLLQQVKVGGYH